MEIISAKYLLTMDSGPLFDGAIAVENGEIIDTGLEEALLARYSGCYYEDYPHHVLMPGLINAHTHLDMTHHRNFPCDPVRSIAADVNFVDWLLNTIEYKKTASTEKLKEAVEEGITACIESGTTCVGDIGSYEGIFQSLEHSGLRGVIFPEILSYDSHAAKNLFETALAIVEKYMEFDSELVGVGVAPYSPYLLSKNILKIMSQYCRSSGLPLAIHVSESFSEMEFFFNSSGDISTRLFPQIGWGDHIPPAHHKTPVEYLDEIDFLNSMPILVGCVNVTPSDMDRIAKKGAKVVWTPRSNHYLKLAETPVVSMRQRGIVVALGTEGISSTNTLSMWDELRFAHKTLSGGKNRLSAENLVCMATRDAARLLGIESETGTLSAGKKADYIVVDVGDIANDNDIYTSLILNTKNYHVHKVVVGGQTLKTVN